MYEASVTEADIAAISKEVIDKATWGPTSFLNCEFPHFIQEGYGSLR